MPWSFSIKLHSETQVSGRLGMSRGRRKAMIYYYLSIDVSGSENRGQIWICTIIMFYDVVSFGHVD